MSDWDKGRELVLDVLCRRDGLMRLAHFGPYVIRLGDGWKNLLDRPWANPDPGQPKSLRQRLLAIERVAEVGCNDANGRGDEVDLTPQVGGGR